MKCKQFPGCYSSSGFVCIPTLLWMNDIQYINCSDWVKLWLFYICFKLHSKINIHCSLYMCVKICIVQMCRNFVIFSLLILCWNVKRGLGGRCHGLLGRTLFSCRECLILKGGINFHSQAGEENLAPCSFEMS